MSLVVTLLVAVVMFSTAFDVSDTRLEAVSAPCPENSMDRSFHRRLNGDRKRNGQEPLILDHDLNMVSNRHTEEMIEDNDLYHTPEDTLRRRVTNWDVLSENVGRGRSVRSLHRAFMESDRHRDVALEEKWNYVGIKAQRARGRVWVTFTFEAYSDPGTRVKEC